jgi:hypothetical protein
VALQHFAKEPFRISLVPAFGGQDVKNVTIPINR